MQIARTVAANGAVPHLGHAVGLRQQPAHLAEQATILHVDVGDLMIRHGEDLRAAGVERFPAELVLDREPAFFPEQAVEMDRPRHGRNAVFGNDEHPHPTGFVFAR